MKSITVILTLFLIICNIGFAQSEPPDTDGDGYRNISTLEQLRWVSENSYSWSWYFELDNDIDATDTRYWNDGAGFSPIGLDSWSPFIGKFDGNDFKIENLYIKRPYQDYLGLFGYTYGENVEISRIGVTNCWIKGNDFIGGLIGYNLEGNIANSYTSGNISGKSFVGGLVGYIFYYGIVRECYTIGDVSGEFTVGGLIGCISTASVINSFSRAYVNCITNSGGLVGYLNNGLVSYCYSGGLVNGVNFSGGLIGQNQYGLVEYSFWDLQTSGQTNSAGGIGKITAEMKTKSTYTNSGWDFDNTWALTYYNNDNYPNLEHINGSSEPQDIDGDGFVNVSTLENLQWISDNNFSWSWLYEQDADIDASETINWNSGAGWKPIGDLNKPFTGYYKGNYYSINGLYIDRNTEDYIGLFGKVDGYSIDNLFISNCSIVGNNFTGGLVGFSINIALDNCHVYGTILGANSTGGIGGKIWGRINNCHFYGTVSGGDSTGGIAGTGHFFVNCTSNGIIFSDSSTTYQGGVVGYISEGEITYCQSNVSMSGAKGGVGGLVGFAKYTSIKNSFANGSVLGSGGDTGGLVGYCNTCFIKNSYATVSVTSTVNSGYIGGLVGYNRDGRIESCFSNGMSKGSDWKGGLVGGTIYGVVTNSFWDKITSGLNYSAGGVGKTTSEMRNIVTYTSAGWNFDTTWSIQSNKNNGYPFLQNFYIPEDIRKYPKINLSTIFLNSETQKITVKGNNFTNSSPLTAKISNKSGSYFEEIEIESDISGQINFDLLYNTYLPNGIYSISIEDAGFAPSKTFIINENEQSATSNLEILDFPNSKTPYFTSKNIIFKFYDYVNLNRNYPTNEGLRQVIYQLYLSSDDGLTWNFQKEFSIYAYPEKKITIEGDLLISSIGEYKIKVIDKYFNERNLISDKFYVITLPSSNIDINITMDNCFQNFAGKEAIGIAADGNSKVLVEIKNNNPQKIIKSVSIICEPLETQYQYDTYIYLGAVENAVNIQSYNTEGLNSVKLSDTINQKGMINYYFWYRAPSLFAVKDDEDYWKNQRIINLKVIIHYENNEIDTLNKPFKIVRPPLILAHGLAGSPSTWDDFGYNSDNSNSVSNFINSSAFYDVNAIELYPSFSFLCNGSKLVFEEQGIFEKTLNRMRNQGIAATQVYYVAHSMGGSIMRYIETKMSNAFYRNDPERFPINNYGKGFVNKIITLNSPHLGALTANLIEKLIKEQINTNIKGLTLMTMYNLYSPKSMLFDLIKPNYSDYIWNTTFSITDAVNDLKTANNGGQEFSSTELPYHTIAGDLISGDFDLPNIPNWLDIGLEKIEELVDIYSYFTEEGLKYTTDQMILNEFKKVANEVNTIKQLIGYIRLSFMIYEGVDFLINSDMIVDVNSQLSGNDRSSTNAKIFDGFTHSSPGNPILKSTDVGNHVFNILNQSNTSEFYSTLPENKRTQQNINLSKTNKNMVNNYEIINGFYWIKPDDNITIDIDSTFQIELELNFLEYLDYIQIDFQDNRIIKSEFSSNMVSLWLPLNGINTLDSIRVYARFTYNGDVYWQEESRNINILNNSNLLDIFLQSKVLYIKKGLSNSVMLNAVYTNDIVSLPLDSTNITFTKSNIVKFEKNIFWGQDFGFTQAIINYKGFFDTLNIIVQDSALSPGGRAILISPLSNSFNISLDEDLYWSLPQNTVSSLLAISEDPTFESNVYYFKIDLDSSFNLSMFSQIKESSTYYWKVMAQGIEANSEYSQVWNFETITLTEELSIPLSSGWNLISLHIQPQLPDSVNNVLDNVEENLVIAKNNSGSVYIPQFDINSIGKWDVTQGYQLYMSSADTLVVTGLQTNPSETPIPLNAGWNMIAYLRNSEMEAPLAFASIIDNGNLVIAKNLAGKVYIPSFGINSIGNLIPGQGYRVYVTNADSLIYPDN